MFNQTQGGVGASNGNPNNIGNKKTNYNWQHNVLLALGDIIAGLTPSGGLATEATALSILASIQNGKEFEQNLVMDLGGVGCPGNCPTYLQIRIWNTVTHTFDPPVYYDATGAAVVPVGPLQIVNPQYVLENILVQLTAINADLDVALSTRASEATALLQLAQLTTISAALTNLDVALSTRASEATLLLTNALLTTIDTVLDNIKIDTGNIAIDTAVISAAITAINTKFDVALSTRASEVTVAAINTKLTPAVRTHNYVISSGVGTVPAGSLRGSVLNNGNAAGVWNGASLPRGVSVPWGDIFSRDTYGAIAFNATGTTFIIEYTT